MAESKVSHFIQIKGPKDTDFRSLAASFSDKRQAFQVAEALKSKLKGHDTRVVKQSSSTTKSEPEVVPARTKPQTGATRKAAPAKPAAKPAAKKTAAKPAVKPAAKKAAPKAASNAEAAVATIRALKGKK